MTVCLPESGALLVLPHGTQRRVTESGRGPLVTSKASIRQQAAMQAFLFYNTLLYQLRLRDATTKWPGQNC